MARVQVPSSAPKREALSLNASLRFPLCHNGFGASRKKKFFHPDKGIFHSWRRNCTRIFTRGRPGRSPGL